MDLLEACKANDAAAWARLVRERNGQVYRWAVLLGLKPNEAEDAAQEVFAVAARRVETCRSEEALGSWLFQITRRVVANARRTGWWRRAVLGEEAPKQAFGTSDPADVDRELAVRACLDRLPRAQAEALILMEIEGYTREEVAEMLGIPAGTVASRVRLAKQSFRTHWETLTTLPDSAELSWSKR